MNTDELRWLGDTLAVIGVIIVVGAMLDGIFVYDEFKGRLLGFLLRKKPLIPENTAWHLVYQLDPQVCTHAEVVKRNRELEKEIEASSFFKTSDRRRLMHLNIEALFSVMARDAVNRAFERVLARQAQETGPTWRKTLGLEAGEKDVARIKQAFRKLASTAHPDHGGDNADMAALNDAYAQAKQELDFA